MTTVVINNTSKYDVRCNDVIVTCKINQQWWAYFKSAPDLREAGDNESEAIGNLIKKNYSPVVKVA